MIDRAIHPLRRRRALADLRESHRPASILVVCHGNLCRSPYAAAALAQRLTRAGIASRVDSAGFSTPNRPPPAEAITAAAKRGVNLDAHRSRIASPGLLGAHDLVLVVDPKLRRAVQARGGAPRVLVLGDLDPKGIDSRAIRDPMGAGADVFEACYDRIDRCLEQLASALVSGAPAA